MSTAYEYEKIDFRGFIISVEVKQMTSAGWNVNIGTDDKALLPILKILLKRGDTVVFDADRETAIKKAKKIIADLLDNT